MMLLEKYLNILHFCFYKAHYKFHLLFSKVNPVHLIHKLPFQKRRYEKLGINIYDQIDRIFRDKNFGLCVTTAGGVLFGGIAIFLFSLLLLLNITISIFYIFLCGVLSYIISYILVFKNDKYIKYFDEYEKLSKDEIGKYNWLTLGSVIITFLLFYLGLTFSK